MQAKAPDRDRQRGRLRDALKLLALLLVLLAARSSLADHNVVPSGSMRPTLLEGDHILVDKLAYGLRVPFSHLVAWDFGGPARGDVVVLDSPVDGERLVKRVVAVPGDRIAVRGGRLVLEGRPVPLRAGAGGLVEELPGRAHLLSLDRGGGPDLGPLSLPPGRYLVLGDNRGNSADGRVFGLVPRELIVGRAVAVWWRDGGLTWLRL
ncbi:MAG TPA: signal peptidase I [Myxococcota bacterium]|nr:signal peptidase I [Myxococcota bacterium]HRY94513.1 signal peptidase I [Myxococcota bacterium]HSA20012.1 signal peptidase I [Myxococcota bacterium]